MCWAALRTGVSLAGQGSTVIAVGAERFDVFYFLPL